MDVDLAGAINFWKCAFDFEALATKAEQDSMRASGVYAGLLYDITDRFSVALRGDGISWSDKNFRDMDMRVAGGVTIKIKDGIFCAAEFARRMPFEGDGVNEIALEVGLEQKIQLPGFQRKTLTRE